MNKRVRVNYRENNSGINADVSIEYDFDTESSETIKNDEVAIETKELLDKAKDLLFSSSTSKKISPSSPWKE